MMVSFTRSARALSPSADKGTEKGKLNKLFPALFTLHAQPQNSASPPTQGQNEKSLQETDTASGMRPESKPTREKRDRRFSTLLLPSAQTSRPSTPPSQEKSPWKFPPTRSTPPKKSLKLLFRRIFTSTLSSTPDKTKATPVTSEEIGSRLWADLIAGTTTSPSLATTLPPPSSATKQRSHTAVIVLPSIRTSPGKSRPKSGVEIVGILQSSGIKRPDSKFSSITSLPSLQSLHLPTSNCSREGGTINISSSGLLYLESCIRRIGRGLAHQEYLDSHLSNNLVFLFTRKEKQIQILRRLRPDEKSSLTSALSRIKESSGRTFLRKAVFLQRSQDLCAQISDILKRSKPNTSQKELNSDSHSLIEVEDRIFDLLQVLGEDVNTQRELDGGLKKAILGAAREKKWSSASGGEKTIMRKFCCFVEARLRVLEGVYGRLEMRVRRMEGLERGV